MTLQERVESLSTDKLKACAEGLYLNDSEAAGDALSATLSELELRLDESEFIAFCDYLETL